MLSLVEQLNARGFEAYAVPREESPLEWPPGAPCVPWSKLSLTPEDIWMVPEGWPNALLPGLANGARCVLYCQNWAYLFSALESGMDLVGLDVSFLAVSQPTAWFVAQTTGLGCPVLRPALDSVFLAPLTDRKKFDPAPVRVAYMPRKNKAVATGIIAAFEARNNLADNRVKVMFCPIEGRSLPEVAAMLDQAHVFISCGFPEGLGLPPLEAMARGCLVVGGGGLGGWDYMRQAWDHPYRPWWPARPFEEAPWTGNGFWTADADIMAGTLALEKAVGLWRQGGPELETILAAGLATAASYAPDQLGASVQNLWAKAQAGQLFVRRPRL